MEQPLLRDQGIPPTSEVLETVLAGSYPVLRELMDIITADTCGLVPQWNYYKDGKAWLCKIGYRKKTICWLSVWDKFFKLGFYFTEKNCSGIANLDIEESIKESFSKSKNIGKLIPLTLQVNRKEQITDILKIIDYKKSLK